MLNLGYLFSLHIFILLIFNIILYIFNILSQLHIIYIFDKLGHKRIKSGLYQMTEQTLMDTVRFIFGATYKAEFGAISPSPIDDIPLIVDHEVSNTNTNSNTNTGTTTMLNNSGNNNNSNNSSNCNNNTVCFGLPCAMKVLGYFVNIIQKYADENNPPKLNRSSSNNTDEIGLEQDVQELVIALKALQSILWSDGNIRNARDIILRYYYY